MANTTYDRTSVHEDGDTRIRERPYAATYGDVPLIRGGFSLWSVLTGMAVALGAMLLLGAVVGGIAYAMSDTSDVTLVQAGWMAGVTFVIAQFLAYLWGGYTAGRMARGAGILNGIAVPVLALGLVALVAWIVGAIVPETALRPSVGDTRLPLAGLDVIEFGIGVGVAGLLAMFLGGAWGGALGARWHDKLENRTEVHDEDLVRA